MWQSKSLATKIVTLVSIAFVLMLLAFYITLKTLNHDTLLKVEKEKAQLIADTAAPLLALRLHLNQQDKIEALIHQIMENPQVGAVRLYSDQHTFAEEKKNIARTNPENFFTIENDIRDPLTKAPMATLRLSYSKANYSKNSGFYDFTLFIVLEVLAVFAILFTLYLRKLLMPLKTIANRIQHFKPGQPLQLPNYLEADEIGHIKDALANMSSRMNEYDNERHTFAQQLEEEVAKKTEQLQRQLYTDNLTNLPNRKRLLEDLSLRLDAVLIVINIDDFRQINDFYGTDIGDRVLQKVAATLNQFSAHFPQMHPYRLSGDEFALFSQLPIKRKSLETFLDEIGNYFAHNSVKIDDLEIDVHVTMGATLQLDRAMEKADIALKSARQSTLPYVIYDESLSIEKKYEANMQWLHRLKYAISHDQIIPYFQPIFDNQDHSIVSYECLIRLQEPDGKILSPHHFLDIAKRARLYTRLTEIMVHKCCEYFRGKNTDFSINLSAADINDEHIRTFITEEITRCDIGDRIIFEILESEGIENYDTVSRFIDEMKSLGCRFAIDDFGSGYSNFEHILRLNIDYIKIDGSLIRDIDTNENAVAIVETIVDFTKKRGLVSIAEFVHNDAVFDRVKRLDIDRSQGYYLGEPKANIL